MNVNFQYSRNLAIEGAILLLLGPIPTIGWVLAIVGIVLLLKAAKELSAYYQDESIYKNSWTGLKYYIIALVALAIGTGIGITSFRCGIILRHTLQPCSRHTRGHLSNRGWFSGCIYLLSACSVEPQKSLQNTRRENRRTII